LFFSVSNSSGFFTKTAQKIMRMTRIIVLAQSRLFPVKQNGKGGHCRQKTKVDQQRRRLRPMPRADGQRQPRTLLTMVSLLPKALSICLPRHLPANRESLAGFPNYSLARPRGLPSGDKHCKQELRCTLCVPLRSVALAFKGALVGRFRAWYCVFAARLPYFYS